ncbi:MAG: hypothetical protein LUC43_06235 [Burkholderiales bacterium]|nr:hypothetical protein [Burkholderiales bacterium]
MGFLGGITVNLQVQDLKVEKASVHPDKEVKAEQILIGRDPVEAIDLIGDLFALCPHSQRAAAEAAISTVIEGALSEDLGSVLARSIQAERIAEGFRYFVLQLSPTSWKAKNTANFVPLWKLVRNLEAKDLTEPGWLTLQEAVSNRLGRYLKNAFEGTWENDLLNGTFKNPCDGLLTVFSVLSRHRTLGWSSVPPLKISNKVFLENLKSTRTPLEKLAKGPFDYFTGACARMRNAPLTSSLLRTDGPSAYTRFVARFEELLQDLQSKPVVSELVSSLRLSDTSAVSIVQNSRGVLLHYVEITKSVDGKNAIADYCILTPTEINVTKAPSFDKSLVGIKAPTEKELEELANLVTLSYDPCTEIKLEINHA